MDNKIVNTSDIPLKAFDLETINIKKDYNMNFSWLTTILSKLFTSLFEIITPSLRDELTSFIKDLYQKALKTNNPYDDYLIKILADLLNITLP